MTKCHNFNYGMTIDKSKKKIKKKQIRIWLECYMTMC